MARASSGSSSCINSVEPLMSANSAVTVLRSPSKANALSACAATALMSDADCRADDISPVDLVLFVKPAPHLPQKLDVGEFSAPHSVQGRVSAFPQRAQKLLSAGFSEPHFTQRILVS